MIRLLFWIVVIFAAVWVWRRMKAPPAPRPQKPADEAASPMVRCSQCGVHVPQAHALANGEHWYCSRAHLEQDTSSGER